MLLNSPRQRTNQIAEITKITEYVYTKYDISLIDPDAPVMISYRSSRHGHACPAINYLTKSPSSKLSLSDRNQSCTYVTYVQILSGCMYVLYLFVGLSFNGIFNPCNPLQQTTRDIINAKI